MVSIVENMLQKVNDFDWSTTPLGARANWPIELEATVRHVLESGFPAALAWGESLTTIYNDAFRPILGNKPEALGRPFAEIWSEAWDQIGPIADDAMSGKSTYIENYPLTVLRGDGPENAWFTFCYSPVRLHDGTICGLLDTVVETTETVRAQADLKLVNEELAHRLKNSLAIVKAVAGQTLRHATEPEALLAFQNRLIALAHAHDVLLEQSWAGGSFHHTLVSSLKDNADLNRIRIDGDDFTIGSRSTMSLSMMLHELTTNSAKYGALSNESGEVDIHWTVDADLLRFNWIELRGPVVVDNNQTGFGTRLIEKGLGPTSRGLLTFAPEGFRLQLDVPLSDLAH